MQSLKKRMRFALIAASVSLSGTAHGLVCLQTNFAEEFNRLNAVTDVYNIAFGTLTQNGSPLEITAPAYTSGLKPGDPPLVNFHKARLYNAILDGGFLDGNRVAYHNRYPVTVQVWCSGPWCGFPLTANPLMMMIKQTPNGMQLELGACPGAYVETPSPRQIEAIQSCLRFGSCGEAQKAAFRF